MKSIKPLIISISILTVIAFILFNATNLRKTENSQPTTSAQSSHSIDCQGEDRFDIPRTDWDCVAREQIKSEIEELESKIEELESEKSELEEENENLKEEKSNIEDEKAELEDENQEMKDFMITEFDYEW